ASSMAVGSAGSGAAARGWASSAAVASAQVRPHAIDRPARSEVHLIAPRWSYRRRAKSNRLVRLLRHAQLVLDAVGVADVDRVFLEREDDREADDRVDGARVDLHDVLELEAQ